MELRHFYIDQQIPTEEPVESEHAQLAYEQFAMRPPTSEDRYFYEEERRTRVYLHADEAQAAQRERRGSSQIRRLPTDSSTNDTSDAGRPLWTRILRALTRHFDTAWRP